jgi:hypothetical protein
MLLPTEPGRLRDAEDALRSIGAVLDTIHARSVLIRQSDAGLMLRAA